jgi:hypothetical protein
MNSQHTLSTAPLEHPAMDYQFLRRAGIEHLERMATSLWTDFNAHDPGITILEQLCYALTDLGYRINYSIPDLLTGDSGSPYDDLFSPDQVLTTAPVTLTDMRKLIIDVRGVKNAWINRVETQQYPLFYNDTQNTLSLRGSPLTSQPVHLRGLYTVQIEMSDAVYYDSTAAENKAAIENEVAARVHGNRGLCEDYESIVVLEPEYIHIEANVEIEAVDDVESLLLDIFQRLSDYISPPVHFYSLLHMLEAGVPLDELFEGPLLRQGFIDTAQLNQAQRRTTLHTSDLIREIMDVRGVRAVRTISMRSLETAPWSLVLNPNQAPKLDLRTSKITLVRNKVPVSVDVDRVRTRFYERLQRAQTHSDLFQDLRLLQPPLGKNRDVTRYHSFQHQFPETYAVGAAGLPDSASPERHAQAKQLKAYLMFFDQLLANYFSQLGHVRDLFAFTNTAGDLDHNSTYFSQILDDPALNLRELWGGDATKLTNITENPHDPGNVSSNRSDRRNRFLNHLLARFAEQFTDYSLIIYDALQGEGVPPAEQIAAHKQAFLRDYIEVSGRRGTGLNVLLPAGDTDTNVSGLQKRIARKLGISADQFYMVENILLRPILGKSGDSFGDVVQSVPFLGDVSERDPFSLRLSFLFPKGAERFQTDEVREFVARTIREETPAHLIVEIHWLGKRELERFGSAYHDWLELRRTYILGRANG